MSRTPWYTPLSNPSYCFDFEYTPRFHFAFRHKTRKSKQIEEEAQVHIKLTDVVTLLFNLSCIPDEVV